MYCSSCGAPVTPGLSYCNRCGAGLIVKGLSEARPKQAPPDQLIWAILGVSVGGIGAIIGLLALMKETLEFGPGLIAGFALLSFLLLLGAESVFIWLLVRSQRGAEMSDEIAQLRSRSPRELDAARTRGLPEAVPSITEHTTHTLEPVRRPALNPQNRE